MGMNMSFMGMGLKGVSASQILSLVTDTLYDQFVEKDIKDFDGFRVAILDTFSTINMALPGKHYDAPSHRDVTDLFEKWNEASPETRKEIFKDFMKKNVKINKVDESMIITAIVAPPAAMVVKRAGQTLPQLKLMKSVPDVVFVPSATVVALIAVKILRLMFMKKTKEPHVDHEVQHSDSSTAPQAPSSDQQHAPAQGPGPEPVTQQDAAPAAPPAAPAEDKTPKHAAANNYCALCKTVH